MMIGSRAKMGEMWCVNASESPDKLQTKVKLQSWFGSTACRCCLRHKDLDLNMWVKSGSTAYHLMGGGGEDKALRI